MASFGVRKRDGYGLWPVIKVVCMIKYTRGSREAAREAIRDQHVPNENVSRPLSPHGTHTFLPQSRHSIAFWTVLYMIGYLSNS